MWPHFSWFYLTHFRFLPEGGCEWREVWEHALFPPPPQLFQAVSLASGKADAGSCGTRCCHLSRGAPGPWSVMSAS